jgi:hypothetical protein
MESDKNGQERRRFGSAQCGSGCLWNDVSQRWSGPHAVGAAAVVLANLVGFFVF